jgi:hypothetical protein
MVAPARTAIERMTSAPAALSPVATTVQEGKFFQAGGPADSGECQLGDGSLGCAHERGLLGRQVGGERVAQLRGVNRELHARIPAVCHRVMAWHEGTHQNTVLGVGLGVAESFAFFGANAAT